MEQQHGLLVVNKPYGVTSAECIKQLKCFGQKKIGHAGTLDPMAKGVLLVLLGHGTKIFSYLLDSGQKIYQGTLCFGITTDTWDNEGTIVSRRCWHTLKPEKVIESIYSWKNLSTQVVPPYSAAKYQGKPLYALSRSGKNFPQKIKKIEISSVEVIKVDLPYVTFRVTCSSGTYIRSLAHSLGIRMGCGAVLTELIREYSFPFGIESAIALRAFIDKPDLLLEKVVPITEALPNWLKVIVTEKEAMSIKNGTPLFRENGQGMPGDKAILILENGLPLALVEARMSIHGLEWIILRGL